MHKDVEALEERNQDAEDQRANAARLAERCHVGERAVGYALGAARVDKADVRDENRDPG